MPFDSVKLRSLEPHLLAPQLPLEAAATRAGLKRFDLALLDRHKSIELGRHAPSWAYRHRSALQPAFGLAIVAGSLGVIALEAHGFALAAGCMAAGIFALLALALLKRMQGPAWWEERLAPDLVGVHPRIADSARRLRGQLPDVEFRVGELFQDRIMLDPYLVAVHGEERLLLGIWNGTTVLLCA